MSQCHFSFFKICNAQDPGDILCRVAFAHTLLSGTYWLASSEGQSHHQQSSHIKLIYIYDYPAK